MKTVLIVQARIESTRFPKKILMDICGQSVLSYSLNRCQQVQGVDEICCAIPDTCENDMLEQYVLENSATLIRGSENDVLSRYYKAATETQADTIIRVTSDCPFIDPVVISETLQLFKDSDCDFACNNHPPSWPHGFDCEITSMDWLEKAHQEATEPFHREHVMPFIRRHPDIRIANLPCPLPDKSKIRITLDSPEDLDFLRQLAAHMDNPMLASTDEIYEILSAHPELLKINSTGQKDTRQ
jgi:spore coat polysaccharide biosynthesis protein SpsF